MGLTIETASAVYFVAIWTLRVTIVVGAVASVVMFVAGAIRKRLSPQPTRVHGEAAELRSSTEAGKLEPTLGFRPDESAAGPPERSPDVDQIAAQAELPLDSVETRPARRNIDVAGKSTLVARLSRFHGTGLDILVFYADSADALPLAITISQALETAGWNVRIWNGPPGQSVRGLRVQTREGADQTVQEPGVQLMLTLQEIGLATRGFDSFHSDHPPDDDGVIAWQNRKLASIRLMIGAKPAERDGFSL